MIEQHRFGVKIMHLSRAWRAELDRRLADKGLSQARWLVLLHLGHCAEPPTQRALAEHIGIESPTLARTLDALEQSRLIERKPCQQDRRVNKVVLTPRAIELVQSLESIAFKLREEIFAGIDLEEVLHFQGVLKKMLDNLNRNTIEP